MRKFSVSIAFFGRNTIAKYKLRIATVMVIEEIFDLTIVSILAYIACDSIEFYFFYLVTNEVF